MLISLHPVAKIKEKMRESSHVALNKQRLVFIFIICKTILASYLANDEYVLLFSHVMYVRLTEDLMVYPIYVLLFSYLLKFES